MSVRLFKWADGMLKKACGFTSIVRLLGGELKMEEAEDGDEQSSGSERLRLRVMVDRWYYS